MALEPLTLYTSSDYFRTLTTRIAATKRGSRIALMTMAYDQNEPHIAALVHELTSAAARGVQVYVLIDAYSFLMNRRGTPTGPALYQGKPEASQRPYFQQRYLSLEKLRKNGGHYTVINSPARAFANPYSGRSHIKLAVVDNTAFLGGCNLDTEQIDYMVSLDDPTTVDYLYELATQVASIKSVRQTLHDTDQTLAVDQRTTIIVDAGKPKQSLIYQSALDFIDTAQEWLVMTCQFFPNTLTAQHLAAAVHRGVRVTLYYNHPRHHAPHMRPVQRAVILAEKTRRPSVLFAHQLPKGSQRLHAKLLASERGAIIGSHNYVTHGVNFGTAEIAIRRYDSAFAQNALQILKGYLPANYTAALS